MKDKILHIFLFILLFQAVSASAQNVVFNAEIDTTEIRIGEQTRMRLKLGVDSGHEVIMPKVEKGVISGGVEILDVKEAKSSDGKRDNYTTELTITSFDESSYVIAPISAIVAGDTCPSNPLGLNVFTLEIDTTKIDSISGTAGIIDVELGWEDYRDSVYLGYISIFVAVVLAWLIVRLVKNKPVIRIIKIKPKQPSHIVAINRINDIKSDSALNVEGNEKELYTRLTDALREYMKERFGFNAPEMITAEIVEELSKIDDKEGLGELKAVLETADLVKFAKMHPSVYENSNNISNAAEFVNATKNVAEENIKQPTEKRIVNRRTRKQKIVLIVSVTLLSLVLAAVVFLLTTDIYNLIN